MQKLVHFGWGGQKAKALLTVNSWVGSKKELKAGLRVQGTPMHTTALLTCEGAAQLSSGGRGASSESRADYPACEQHKSHVSPMVETRRDY